MEAIEERVEESPVKGKGGKGNKAKEKDPFAGTRYAHVRGSFSFKIRSQMLIL